MKLDNPTPFEATVVPLMGPADCNFLTVIIKATFIISPEGINLASEQEPIAYGDHFLCQGPGGRHSL